MNELAHALLEIAREHDVEAAQIVRLARHPCLTGTFQGRLIKFAFPGSPSDWRGHLNTVAGFYRYLGVTRPKARKRRRKQHLSHAQRKRGRHERVARVSWLSLERRSTRLNLDPFAALAQLRSRSASTDPTYARGDAP